MTQKLVFKNYQLETLLGMLWELTLTGSHSRMRTRFIQLLENQLGLIEQERNGILTNYAKKDENDELVKEQDASGATVVIMEDKEQYLLEVKELQNEDFIVEVSASNKQMIESVANSLLNAELELSGRDAVVYDVFCTIFENINFDEIV